MLTLAQFQNAAYMVNRNHVVVAEQVIGKHHRVRSQSRNFSHSIGNSIYPNVKQINISPGAGTVYLPYYQDQVASVKLPTAGPSVFVTDNLSGCCIYIGRKITGELVVFHANSQTGSKQAVMHGQKPSYQTAAAASELDQLVSTAKHNHVNVTIVGVLSKSRYYAKLDSLAATGDQFIGGTTVVGFRTGTNWEFWFQNFGNVNNGPTGLLHHEKFFP
jgi:hypothetical protein